MDRAVLPQGRFRARELVAALAIIATLKLVVLVLDPTARVFLGDSGSYLHAALTDWVPPDRSFTYPWLLRASAVLAGSIHALVALQSLLGIASGLLLFGLLRIGLGVPQALALAAVAAFALEPAQLFYERMMMAESAGQLALALQLVAIAAYVRQGSLLWIPLYVALGVLALSFRLSLLPTVATLGLLAPIVRSALHHQRVDRGRPLVAALRLGAHLLLALVATQQLHGAYKHWASYLTDAEPAYIARQGMMRLGLVLPLVQPSHLERSGVDPALLQEVRLPLADHRAREAHMWSPNGLYAQLEARVADPDRVAGKISIRALREDPLGLLRLSALTLADYFEPEVWQPRLQDDIGRRMPSDKFLADLRRHLRYEASEVPASNGLVTRWFTVGAPWLTACLFLLAPLALATLALRWSRHPEQRDLLLVLTLASLGLVASHALFSHIVSFRYLHPLPWLFIAQLALLVHSLAASRRGRASVPAR
jgi:hypothetical protein